MKSLSPCFIAILLALFLLLFSYGVLACDDVDKTFEESIAEECAQSWFKCLPINEGR